MMKEKINERKLLPPRAMRRCGSLSPEAGVIHRSWKHGWGLAGKSWNHLGVVGNGAVAGTKPLPEMGQHQMSQTWQHTRASPLLLPSSLPLTPYPSSPTWKQSGRGPGKCDFLQYRAQQGRVRQGSYRNRYGPGSQCEQKESYSLCSVNHPFNHLFIELSDNLCINCYVQNHLFQL